MSFLATADSPYVMYILEVEGGVLAWFSGLVAPEVAEALRRRTPIRRDRFDNFIFEATLWAVDEGAANSLSFACEHFKAARQEGAAAVGGPVPLVPPTVTEHVDRIVSRWRPGQQVHGAIDLQHAITLLAQGQGIDDVARGVGYRSVSTFGTAFRRVTGMSPGRFRDL